MAAGRSDSEAQDLQRAFELHQNGQLSQAETIYESLVARGPHRFDAIYLLGMLHSQQGRFKTAAEFFGQVAKAKPGFVAAHYSRGVALNALARHKEAIDSYDKLLRIAPDHSGALQNRAASLFALRRFQDALDGYDLALALNEDEPKIWGNRGIALRELHRFAEAVESYDRAIRMKPDYAEAYNNRGVTLNDLNRFNEALESFDCAIEIKPNYFEAYFNRGVAFLKLKHFHEAVQSYDRAIEIKPDYAEAFYNRGFAFLKLKRFSEAFRSSDRAIQIKPDYAEAYNNRAVALLDLQRFDDALADCDRAIEIKPDDAEAHNNRGAALIDLGRVDEALQSCNRAVELKPDYAEAFYNRSLALTVSQRFEEALQSYDSVLEIRPDYEFIDGARLYTKMRICDWTDFESDVAALCDKASGGGKASDPFSILAAVDSPLLQRKVAEIFGRDRNPPSQLLPKLSGPHRRDKIRLGYFSADFHDHATAFLMADLFERHDRSKFELIAFSFDPVEADEMRKRLRPAFDQFIDIRNKSDEDVCRLARTLEIDIAIDLKGFTQFRRTNIFAMRAAPIQVNYLGYPGTMGVEYIDYLIADPTLIPPRSRPHYTEKIVYLPNSYQPNDRRRRISEREFTRAELGLPQDGFVFCCFNNTYKITPRVFDGWMRILKQVDGGVLWLFESAAGAVANLREEARARDVDPERLIFARRMALPEHLARHRLADVFLDTFPYNAHTTASDALWAGLPVVTRSGETFAGRVAASLLNAIDLPELITTSPQDYEALAAGLACDPAKLDAIKRKLAANRLTAPLFDTPRFTRHFEAAYTAMYERYHAGLPPEHLHVAQ